MAQLNTDLETIKTARDNMKTALEGQGQTVTKDIRTYAQAIANISGGGSSDVKLFDTIEHMQQDPNAQDGDLAVVYREELQPVTEESEFDSCVFPNEVVLDEAFTGSISGSFRSTDGGFFDGMVNMSSSSFRFDGFGDEIQITVIATGFDQDEDDRRNSTQNYDNIVSEAWKKRNSVVSTSNQSNNDNNSNELDIPTFLRKNKGLGGNK